MGRLVAGAGGQLPNAEVRLGGQGHLQVGHTEVVSLSLLFEDLDSLGVLHLNCGVILQRLEFRVQHQDPYVHVLTGLVYRLVRLQKQGLSVHNADLRQIPEPLSFDFYFVGTWCDSGDLDGNRAGPFDGCLRIGYRISAAHQSDCYITLRGLLSLEQGEGYALKLT